MVTIWTIDAMWLSYNLKFIDLPLSLQELHLANNKFTSVDFSSFLYLKKLSIMSRWQDDLNSKNMEYNKLEIGEDLIYVLWCIKYINW